MKIRILQLGLLLAAHASAQNPIPRVGDDCPTGTYSSGDGIGKLTRPGRSNPAPDSQATALLQSANALTRRSR